MAYFSDIATPAWADDSAVVMAGVTPYESLSAPSRRLNRDTDEQLELKDWYRSCGPVRVAVNTRATTAAQLDYPVEFDNGRGWERVNDPKIAAIMAAFRGRDRSAEELRRQIGVMDQIPGEGYLILNTGNSQVDYKVIQSCTLSAVQNRPGWSEYYTTRKKQPGERGHHMVQDRYVNWFHHPDPDYPDDSWSPVLAAAESIGRFKKAYRHVSRTLDSKLAMSNILWVQATTNHSAWQKELWDWNFEAIENDDGIQSVSPFMMQTENEPKYIESGSDLYAEQLAIANDALAQIARDLDFPTSWMIEGPGQAKFDNEAETYEWYLDNSVAPIAANIADIKTRAHLRPFLSATELGRGLDPQRFRVGVDDSTMRRATENNDRLYEAVCKGLIGETKSAEILGIGIHELASRPSGVSWEQYLAARSANNLDIFAPATVDAEVIDLDAVPSAPALESGDDDEEMVAASLTESWDALI